MDFSNARWLQSSALLESFSTWSCNITEKFSIRYLIFCIQEVNFESDFLFFKIVALNYQSEGRMLQLNRAKFSANGNCGYVLKPNCMCQGKENQQNQWVADCMTGLSVGPCYLCLKMHFWCQKVSVIKIMLHFHIMGLFILTGVFNPNSEDPLPGQLKKQLVLRIISGQQLPKPRDSMLGDRGEVWGSWWLLFCDLFPYWLG